MTLSEDDLRRALERDAAEVAVAPDALGRIRRQIKARKSRWWLVPRFGTRPRGGAMFAISMGTGVTVATTVVAVVVGVGSCAPVPTTTDNHPPATATSTTPAPSGTGTNASTVQMNVPVYFIGYVDGAPKLYREYHHVAVPKANASSQVAAALRLMFAGTAADPDYASQWPAGTTVRSVKVSNGVATVDLHGATVNADDPAGNRAAIWQLVWTATAYSGAKGVRLLFDGTARTTLWKSRQQVSGTLRRTPAVDTLAPVWIIDPQAQASVGTNVRFNLAGIVFEGTIQLRIRDHSGNVVKQLTVQLSVGAPAQGTAMLTLTLPPGDYVAQAYYASAKDGSVKGMDTHAFTVT